jgi:hypothetical protein
VRMQFTAFCRSCFRLTRTRSVFVFLCFDFRHDFVPPTDCRHRATGKYEAHLWDAHCWSSAQNKKGKQGETESWILFALLGNLVTFGTIILLHFDVLRAI